MNECDLKNKDILIGLEELQKISHGFINFNPRAEQLVNIRKACRIPNSEKILGIIDETLFGSAKEGIAFTEKAIYNKSAFLDPFNFNWKSLINYEIKVGITCAYITINSYDYDFDSYKLSKMQMATLLRSLQSLIRDKLKNTAIISTNSSPSNTNNNCSATNIGNYTKPTALNYFKLPFKEIFNYERARQIKSDSSPELYLLKIYALDRIAPDPDIVGRFAHDIIASMCIDFATKNNDKYNGLRIEFIQNPKSFYLICRAFFCLIIKTIKTKLVDKRHIESIIYALIPAFAYDDLNKQIIHELSKNKENFNAELSSNEHLSYSDFDFEKEILDLYSEIKDPDECLLLLYMDFLDVSFIEQHGKVSYNIEKVLHYADFYDDELISMSKTIPIEQVKILYIEKQLIPSSEYSDEHTEMENILDAMHSSLYNTYRRWEPFLTKLYYYIGKNLGDYLGSQNDIF